MGLGLNIQRLDYSDTTPDVTYTYDRRSLHHEQEGVTVLGSLELPVGGQFRDLIIALLEIRHDLRGPVATALT